MSDPAPVTGFDRLDEAIAPLARLDDAAVPDHPELFDAAHAALRDALMNAPETSHEPTPPA